MYLLIILHVPTPFCLPERHCPPLPALTDPNTGVNTTSTAAGVVVLLTCTPGTTLLDGLTSRVSTCDDGIAWVPNMDDICQGRDTAVA